MTAKWVSWLVAGITVGCCAAACGNAGIGSALGAGGSNQAGAPNEIGGAAAGGTAGAAETGGGTRGHAGASGTAGTDGGNAGGTPGCPAGQTLCGSACVNLDSDWENCGLCDNVCILGRICVARFCVCSAGLTDCGDGCVDLDLDAWHCGSCGNACGPDETCSEGTCVDASAMGGGFGAAGGSPGRGGAGAGGRSAGGSGGQGSEGDSGAAGAAGQFDPLCTPQTLSLRPCQGYSWVDARSQTCTVWSSMMVWTEECEGKGFETIEECLEACDPDSVCLISPPQSTVVSPCIPEIHGTANCWYGGCICSCQGEGESGSWICGC